MTKITIHTPSAGTRAITVGDKVGRYVIRAAKVGAKTMYRLIDTYTPGMGTEIGSDSSVCALKFALINHLATA